MIFERSNTVLHPLTNFSLFVVWVYNFRTRCDDDVIFSVTPSFDVKNNRAKFQGHNICGSCDSGGVAQLTLLQTTAELDIETKKSESSSGN